MIYNFEPLAPRREIDTSNIDHGFVLALCMIPEEREHRGDGVGRDVEREFVFEHAKLLNEFRERLDEVRAI